MKRPWWLITLSLVSFALTYAVAFDVVNHVSVYWLHQTDPKFGGAAGNIRFGHELLITLTLLAASFHFGALIPFWPALRHAALTRIITLGALAALGAEVIQTGLDAGGGAGWLWGGPFAYGIAPALTTLLVGALLLPWRQQRSPR
ncbi:MAG TPA: hypothetical protein VFK04_11285 [Gemmatimonadaceae bacterium]|nr:hypothetical protein [Gemmatimonadaceae bacterium]